MKKEVLRVVAKEGGIDCCRVCGLAFEDIPDKIQFCYRHKKLVQSTLFGGVVTQQVPKHGRSMPRKQMQAARAAP